MREKFHWLKKDEVAYLVMDQAGGHGSNDAIDEYRRTLKEKYNVEIILQVPRSPYTNVLDLGVWCALQSIVEKQHRGKRCQASALVETVADVWRTTEISRILTNVFDRMKKVLVLIVEAEGKNDLVETKRGKRFRSLDRWHLPPLESAAAAIDDEADAAHIDDDEEEEVEDGGEVWEEGVEEDEEDEVEAIDGFFDPIAM